MFTYIPGKMAKLAEAGEVTETTTPPKSLKEGKLQSTLDISISDISNSAKLEASI